MNKAQKAKGSYQHQLLFLVRPYRPLLLLFLRLLFVLFACTLLLFVVSDAPGMGLSYLGPSAGVESLWLPFSSRDESSESLGEVLAPVAPPRDDTEALNKDPNYPSVSSSLYDHQQFSFFDGSKVYANVATTGGQASRRPSREERRMLAQVLERAVQYLAGKYQGRYEKEHCKSTRYRNIHTIGLEVDVTCQDQEGHIDRVSLLQPYRSPQVLYHHSLPKDRSLSIIMPLQGRYSTLKLFLENLKSVLTSGPAISIGLSVVYFDDDQSERVRVLLQEAEKTPGLRTEFILVNSKFSRGLGLQRGAEETKLEGEVLFFCDVDAFFTREFLTRCLATPVLGHQVFMPTVFSLYNPEFVYGMRRKKAPLPLKQMSISDNSGYWRIWGHGMVCVFKSDFLKVGMPYQPTQWGKEDLSFLHAVTKTKRYKVIRSLDPGLFHLYHPKSCSDTSHSWDCHKSRAISEASKEALGLWYFKRKENISLHPILEEASSMNGRTLGAKEDSTLILAFLVLLVILHVAVSFCIRSDATKE